MIAGLPAADSTDGASRAPAARAAATAAIVFRRAIRPRPASTAASTSAAGCTRAAVVKPAVIEEIQFVNGEVKYAYKTTINPN